MMGLMRTTVSIDDEIYERASRIALESDCTFDEVVNELLAAGLEQRLATATGRELGRLQGSIRVAADFDATPDDLIEAFEADL